MIIRIPRLASVILCITILAWFIPSFYQKSTRPDRFFISAQYSPILQRFIMLDMGHNSARYRDENGQIYPNREARMLLPLSYPYDLGKWGEFPLELEGQTFSFDRAIGALQRISVSPRDVNTKTLPLYTLLESNPEGASLITPPDIFSVKPRRIEFINVADGSLNEEKSVQFTHALTQSGVIFPLKLVNSNPSPLKPFDEGAFIIDANNRIFQLKIVNGQPVSRDLGVNLADEARYMSISENQQKEIYGLIATDHNVYLIMYDNRLQPLPLDSYTANQHSIDMRMDALYRIIIKTDVTDRLNGGINLLAANKQYLPVRRLHQSMPDEIKARTAMVNKGLSLLTPFTIKQFESTQASAGLYIDLASDRLFMLFGMIASLLGYALWRKARHQSINVIEMIVVFFSGLPGLIAILLFGPVAENRQKKS